MTRTPRPAFGALPPTPMMRLCRIEAVFISAILSIMGSVAHARSPAWRAQAHRGAWRPTGILNKPELSHYLALILFRDVSQYFPRIRATLQQISDSKSDQPITRLPEPHSPLNIHQRVPRT